MLIVHTRNSVYLISHINGEVRRLHSTNPNYNNINVIDVHTATGSLYVRRAEDRRWFQTSQIREIIHLDVEAFFTDYSVS